jgi:hypothetical protein
VADGSSICGTVDGSPGDGADRLVLVVSLVAGGGVADSGGGEGLVVGVAVVGSGGSGGLVVGGGAVGSGGGAAGSGGGEGLVVGTAATVGLTAAAGSAVATPATDANPTPAASTVVPTNRRIRQCSRNTGRNNAAAQVGLGLDRPPVGDLHT